MSDTESPNSFMQLKRRGYQFHVFISWPHMIQEAGRKIVEQLATSLKDKLRDYNGGEVFLDLKRIEPGNFWDPQLRVSLCRSGLTIYILVPSFFESKYCKTEWQITETLQEQRLPKDRPELTCMLPVLLKDSIALPEQIKPVQCDRSLIKMLTYKDDLKGLREWDEAMDALVNRIEKIFMQMCRVPEHNQDWNFDETLAAQAEPKVFTWPQSGQAPAAPRRARTLPLPVTSESKL